jgi:hypothetical protein
MTDIFICDPDGGRLRAEQDAVDLIGEAGYRRARWVALPAGRLDEDFWRLSTKVAGDFAQKFAQYGMGLAIVGDISEQLASSAPLRDWVREANRGRQIWFVEDMAELERRLGISGG